MTSRLYLPLTSYFISSHYYDKCVDFADAQISTSQDLYAYRGESKVDKMVEDITVGKMGELASMMYLKDLGYDCSKPDFEIYETKRKSFDADLTCEDYKIHVKSQSMASVKRYGPSWLFQKRDSLVSDPEANEYMLFAAVDGSIVHILACLKAVDIVELYDEPRVPRYRTTKKALYLEHILDAGVRLNKLYRKRS